MWTGFGSSVNTFFVPLEQSVGADKVVNVAQRLGIKFRSSEDNELATKYAKDWGAFTLGVSATTPLELANAYATVAADGTYCGRCRSSRSRTWTARSSTRPTRGART